MDEQQRFERTVDLFRDMHLARAKAEILRAVGDLVAEAPEHMPALARTLRETAERIAPPEDEKEKRSAQEGGAMA